MGRSRKSAPGGDCWPGSAVTNWVVVRKLPGAGAAASGGSGGTFLSCEELYPEGGK